MFGIKRFIINFSAQFGASVINAICSLLFTAYLARHLGVVLFGKLSLVQIFVLSFLTLTDLGTSSIIVREVVRNKDRLAHITANVFAFKLILGIIAYAITYLSSIVMGYDTEIQQLIAIYSLSTIAYSLNIGIVSIFNGLERMTYSSIVVAGTILGYVLSTLALWQGYALIHVLSLLAGSMFLATLFEIIVLRTVFKIPIRLNFDLPLWKYYVIDGFPFGIISILTVIGSYSGIFILSYFSGPTEVGYFNSANKIASIFMLFIGAYNATVFPLFSRLQGDSKENLFRAYKFSTKIMLIFGSCAALSITIFSSRIMALVFPEFTQAIPVLQILCWYSLSALLATVTMNLLYSEGRQREASRIVFISMIASVGINVLLTPIYKSIGVAIATTIFTLLQYVLSYKKIVERYPLPLTKIVLQSIFIALCVGASILLFLSTSVVISCIAACLIFIVLVHMTHVFDKEERDIFLNIIRTFRRRTTIAQQPTSIQPGESN